MRPLAMRPAAVQPDVIQPVAGKEVPLVTDQTFKAEIGDHLLPSTALLFLPAPISSGS